MRRSIVAVAMAAALACTITTPPASAAAAIYTCTSGTRFLLSDILGYFIIASGCTGPAGPGGGTVSIPSGTYHCITVNLNTTINLLNGQRC
ncbi:hypothetical protein ACIBKY_41465 [Nonomuraea sp. NPDC050394]|uniref:hypothetical protein n=1 Tax=Nonomuraea sp. NPDC050394 TaxID=3364363 RepID=UPI0037A49456